MYLSNGNVIAFKDVRTLAACYEIIPDLLSPNNAASSTNSTNLFRSLNK